MKKAVILSFTAISCLATAAVQAANYSSYLRTSHPAEHASKSSKQSLFSNIDSSGHLDITIVPMKTASREFFSVREPAKNARVIAHIRNHTLYLRQSSATAKPAQVTIHMNNLNHLSLSGQGSVIANHLHSNGFSLTTDTTGHIDLNGMITVNSLSVFGPSKVNLKWVSGNNIAVYASNKSHINIAGDVGTVRVKLADHSFLNAKYLRAQHTWIKTTNFAQAEITSSKSLQAYPKERSNIYYYKTPALLNPINSQAGNTLQLGWDD